MRRPPVARGSHPGARCVPTGGSPPRRRENFVSREQRSMRVLRTIRFPPIRVGADCGRDIGERKRCRSFARRIVRHVASDPRERRAWPPLFVSPRLIFAKGVDLARVNQRNVCSRQLMHLSCCMNLPPVAIAVTDVDCALAPRARGILFQKIIIIRILCRYSGGQHDDSQA